MIWELDEDCDRHVSWAEFELMFTRCRADKVRPLRIARARCCWTPRQCVQRKPLVRAMPQTGLEPGKLFSVVEFMMHDKDASGKVSFDECMEIMYRRFGKEMLEERTNDFFKLDLDGDNEINFAEFQRQMAGARGAGGTQQHRPGLGRGRSGAGTGSVGMASSNEPARQRHAGVQRRSTSGRG